MFISPVFVLPADADQLHGVEEIVQGIGPVPQLVLPPEAGGDGQEEKFVQVRALGGQEFASAVREAEPPSPKKPSSVQRTSSRVSWRQVTGSWESSGQDHSPRVMTGQ